MQVDSDPLGECTGASPATTSASEGSEGTTQPAASQAVKGVGLEGIVVAILSIAALQWWFFWCVEHDKRRFHMAPTAFDVLKRPSFPCGQCWKT